MRVCIIISRGDVIGGAQVHIIQLANFLSASGHKVAIICGGRQSVIDSRLVNEEIDILLLKQFSNAFRPLADIHSFRQAKRFLKGWRPDVIHLHSTKAGIVFRLLALYEFSSTIIYTVHGWGFTSRLNYIRSAVILRLEKVLRCFINHYIVVSEYDYRIGLRNGLINSLNSSLIYNGVKERNISNYNPQNELLKIAMVARFDNQKDHLTLLQAVKELDFCEVHLIGDGPKLEAMKSYYEASQFKSEVHFLGKRNDVLDILSRMDLFCLISNYEGFPISTIEAMSLGLPVVVTDVGGAGEVLKYGECGKIVPKGDYLFLRQTLENLHLNRGMLRNFSKTALKISQNHFSEAAMLKSILKIYDSFDPGKGDLGSADFSGKS